MKMKKMIVLLFITAIIICTATPSFAGISLTDQGFKIGAWLGVQPNANEISNFQTLQQRKLDTVMTYIDWNTEFSSIQSSIMDPIYNNGSIAIFTWEANGLTTVDINNGSKDAYITRMANAMKSYGREIWIPLMHEANGNWYSWAIGDSTVNTNDTYKAAYRRVVTIFRNQGAANVKWIFNINCTNNGANSSYLGHYPGDSYVDYLAIDGYNWGTTQSWGSVWQTFDEIFLTAYNTLAAIDKPIIIDEMASTEIGGDKAAWITNSFNTIRTSYPRIKAISWFNQNKETDWRINSSQAALGAYRAAINDSSTPTATPTLAPTATPVATPTPIVTVTPTPVQTATPAVTTAPSATPTPVSQTGNIKVEFYNQGTATTSNQLYLNIKLNNTGSGAITLSNVKIRYYYTIDGAQTQNFYCDYSPVGSGNVTGTFVTMSTPKTSADTYVEIGFSSGAGNLVAGGNTTIQARIAKSNWTNYTQTNDYSFNSSANTYVEWTKVSGFVSGVLQWGTEP